MTLTNDTGCRFVLFHVTTQAPVSSEVFIKSVTQAVYYRRFALECGGFQVNELQHVLMIRVLFRLQVPLAMLPVLLCSFNSALS